MSRAAQRRPAGGGAVNEIPAGDSSPTTIRQHTGNGADRARTFGPDFITAYRTIVLPPPPDISAEPSTAALLLRHRLATRPPAKITGRRVATNRDGTVAFMVPASHRRVVQAFPVRRWQDTGRRWLVPAVHADAVADALQAAGCDVGAPGGGADWPAALAVLIGAGPADQVFEAINAALGNTVLETIRNDNTVTTPADPGPPRRGRLFATRFVDRHGRVGSRLFRRRSSAERFAAQVEARGGTAAVFWSRIGAWSK